MSSQSALDVAAHKLPVLDPEGTKVAELAHQPTGRSAAATLGGRTGKVIVYIIAFLWTVPNLGLLISSFRPEIPVKTTGWWMVFKKPKFTLSNYKSVWGSTGAKGGDNLSHYFMNSLRITIPSVVISVGLASLAAYAFSWMKFKGRDGLYAIVITMLIVPLQTALIPLLRMFTGGAHQTFPGLGTVTLFPDFNLHDSVVTIWMAHACFGMPFCVFLLRNFMAGLPKEVMEAGRVDGAGHLTMFRKVVLPLSVPAIASVTIYQFVYIYNDLLIGKIFGGTKNFPIIAKLVEVSGNRGESWHLLTAAAFISMVLPLIVFFSLQKYFVKGLLAGAVKG
jgi:alpha-glucoside transport system permease protein